MNENLVRGNLMYKDYKFRMYPTKMQEYLFEKES